MFRHIVATILITAFAVQTFHGAFIVIDYYANTASFAKNCENKNKPMMHCNGKCQMIKKIKADEKDNPQNPGKKFENKIEVLYSRSFFANRSAQKWININSYNPAFILRPVRDISLSIFHPPSLV